jgi:L-fuculose-phosphate aldolase
MDGNLSVRLDQERVLATPTAICKGNMRPSDLIIVDMEGRRLAGRRNVSSEIGMHLLIYKLRPDVRGVVHAHPPTATGFAAAGMSLDRPLICEVVVALGLFLWPATALPERLSSRKLSSRSFQHMTRC